VVGQGFPSVLLGSRVFFLVPGRFGAKVDDARDGSWRRCFARWLHLATNPSDVGVDMDGLACSRQMRGNGLLKGVVLSYRCSGWWHLSRGCEALGLGYLVEC
jgi:hypothetical protein